MVIPPEQLTREVLIGIVESYITREGTDYGEHELDLDSKVKRLLPQVLKGEVLIVYDEESQSVNLVPKDDASIV
ncbi:YheU family protein [Agarilytica rhodophyticola]|uniref:YheU family protein n=1 Tax=Agarilytica rhodophyticola TaxID=1737490 RepID=UPI000B344859|nr:YheU family protein [Agarilytica rhodophyticola]